MLHNRKPRFWILFFSIVIMFAVGIGLIANPKTNKAVDIEQVTEAPPEIINEDTVNNEIKAEPPEESAVEILSGLANQKIVIEGNEISEADRETVITFGKHFVNLYNGAVAEQIAVSFANYISNQNLLKFTDKMLALESEMILKGMFSYGFGLENEINEAVFKKRDKNVYYLNLSFQNEGSNRGIQMLVQSENKALKIVDFYFGTKDSVDTMATGHPAERKLTDPKLWDDQAWVDGVFEKIEKFESEIKE